MEFQLSFWLSVVSLAVGSRATLDPANELIEQVLSRSKRQLILPENRGENSSYLLTSDRTPLGATYMLERTDLLAENAPSFRSKEDFGGPGQVPIRKYYNHHGGDNYLFEFEDDVGTLRCEGGRFVNGVWTVHGHSTYKDPKGVWRTTFYRADHRGSKYEHVESLIRPVLERTSNLTCPDMKLTVTVEEEPDTPTTTPMTVQPNKLGEYPLTVSENPELPVAIRITDSECTEVCGCLGVLAVTTTEGQTERPVRVPSSLELEITLRDNSVIDCRKDVTETIPEERAFWNF